MVSEAWLAANGYCLACDSDYLARSIANTRCTDFSCIDCGQLYELKTFHRRPITSLIDGAYAALMTRIMSGSAPALFLLQRNAAWRIEALTLIHPLFLTPPVIERRPPLSPSAVRAGWIGCKIRLDRIGPDGEVILFNEGRETARSEARKQFRRYLPLSNLPASDRGWTVLTLSVIRALTSKTFSLTELYRREEIFMASYPKNHHVRAKIRQQLQVLRDLGVIRFDGKGAYTLVG